MRQDLYLDTSDRRVPVPATSSHLVGTREVAAGCFPPTALHTKSQVQKATQSHRPSATDLVSPNSLIGCRTLTANSQSGLLIASITTIFPHAAVAHQGLCVSAHRGNKETSRNATAINYDSNARGPPRPAR